VGLSISPLLRSYSQQQQCEAFLSFVFLAFGMVLPLLLMVNTEPPTSLRAWDESRGTASSLAGRLAESLEAAIRQLCGRSWLAPGVDSGGDAAADSRASSPRSSSSGGSSRRRNPCVTLRGWQRGVAWWLLLSLLWAMSVLTVQ
jgi:hypothetical protein